MFVPVWLVLTWCVGAIWGVCFTSMCHFDLTNGEDFASVKAAASAVGRLVVVVSPACQALKRGVQQARLP